MCLNYYLQKKLLTQNHIHITQFMQDLIVLPLTWLLPSSSHSHITPSDDKARAHFQVRLPITNVTPRNCLCCFAFIMHLLVS